MGKLILYTEIIAVSSEIH